MLVSSNPYTQHSGENNFHKAQRIMKDLKKSRYDFKSSKEGMTLFFTPQ